MPKSPRDNILSLPLVTGCGIGGGHFYLNCNGSSLPEPAVLPTCRNQFLKKLRSKRSDLTYKTTFRFWFVCFYKGYKGILEMPLPESPPPSPFLSNSTFQKMKLNTLLSSQTLSKGSTKLVLPLCYCVLTEETKWFI